MNRQHILITGGAGFVASAMAEKLAEDENNFIVIVDNLLTGDISRIPQKENVRFIKADVNRLEDISDISKMRKLLGRELTDIETGLSNVINNPSFIL